MVDDALDMSYAIITNQCLDTNLQVTSTDVVDGNGLQSAINFSYIGFKFTQSVDNQVVDMKLRCSVS